MFEALGSFIYRRCWLVLLGAGALLVLAVFMLLRGGALSGGIIRDLEAEQAERLTEDVLGHSRKVAFVAVFRAKHAGLTESELRAAVSDAVAPLRRLPGVQSVLAPTDVPSGPGAPRALVPRMLNAEARAAFAIVTLAGTPKDALRAYPSVRAALRSDRLTIVCTGHVPFLHDLGETLA